MEIKLIDGELYPEVYKPVVESAITTLKEWIPERVDNTHITVTLSITPAPHYIQDYILPTDVPSVQITVYFSLLRCEPQDNGTTQYHKERLAFNMVADLYMCEPEVLDSVMAHPFTDNLFECLKHIVKFSKTGKLEVKELI